MRRLPSTLDAHEIEAALRVIARELTRQIELRDFIAQPEGNTACHQARVKLPDDRVVVLQLAIGLDPC